MWTQSSVRLRLAPAAYREFLKPVTAHYEAHPDREYPWDPATGTCGEHSRFVAEALGVKRFYPEHFRVVPPTPAGRRRVMADLDAGFLVELYHDYIRTGPDMFPLLPKDNRVAGHRFMVGRSGGKYVLPAPAAGGHAGRRHGRRERLRRGPAMGRRAPEHLQAILFHGAHGLPRIAPDPRAAHASDGLARQAAEDRVESTEAATS